MIKTVTSIMALCAATQVWASSFTGDYLAMNYAFERMNDAVASSYLDRALEALPESAQLYDQALIMAMYERDIEKGARLVEEAYALGTDSQIPNLVELSIAINAQDFKKIETLAAGFEFFDKNIIEAWALAGNGDSKGAVEWLKKAVEDSPDFAPLYKYEQAMIIAGVDQNYIEASEILRADDKPLLLTSTSYLDFWAIRILAKEDDIEAKLAERFGAREYWPNELAKIVDHSLGGEVHPSLGFASAQNGISEYINFTIGQSEISSMPQGIERIFYMVMPVMAPKKEIYNVHLLTYFMETEEYDDVLAIADQIEDGSLYAMKRDIFRFYAYLSLEDLQGARASLNAPSSSVEALSFHADAQRQIEEYEIAYETYLRVLEFPDLSETQRSKFEFLAGVTAQQIEQNDAAFSHLQNAVDLDPENTEFLNHLGYSLVDTGRDIDAGLDMVKKAADLSDGQSHILDSLGWAYFKIGKYEDALGPIEMAISKMAYHPVINAHLGDVYWKLGREREAVYNWKRALANLEEDMPDITKAELEDRLANGLE